MLNPLYSRPSATYQDLAKNLYESSYINFTSILPRPLLEEFGAAVAQSNSVEFVEQVYDQYLDFVVLEPTLFSLLPSNLSTPAAAVPSSSSARDKNSIASVAPSSTGNKTIYESLNDPKATEADIEALVDRISMGLMSVIATTGQVPLIRCPRGNAAEMVALKLDARLRDQVHSRTSNAFNDHSNSSFSRPSASLSITTFGIDSVMLTSRRANASPCHLGQEYRPHPHGRTLLVIPSSGERRA